MTVCGREPYVHLLHRVISGLLTRLNNEQKARRAWYDEAKRWQSLYQATQKPADPFPKAIECDGTCWSKGCENPASGPPVVYGWSCCFLCADCASVYSRGEADMVWWKDTDGRIHPPKGKP